MRLALLILALFAAVLAASVREASAGPDSCQVVAEGPFFYAGLVFPATKVECDAVKRRMKISAVLTRDGEVVARGTRTCRARSVCHLGVEVRADDLPGNQEWCVRASGSVGNRSLGEARSCETESF
jgi:hypothetical protein